MRNIRCILGFVLTLTLLAGLCVPALAVEEPITIKDGVLTKYAGPGGTVTVPNGITTISHRVFFDRLDVTALVIPQTVTDIGWGAFGGSGLTRLDLPQGLRFIGWGAFENCAGLTAVTIPDTVTVLEPRVFAGCTALAAVTIPTGLTAIPWGAFAGCVGLRDVTIPPSVADIGDDAFAGCVDLTIHGQPGSYAETYAHRMDFSFAAQAPDTAMAFPTDQVVPIMGNPVTFRFYSVKTAGRQSDYIKLRDLASALADTPARFNVAWNGGVAILPGADYLPNGTEMTTPYTGPRQCRYLSESTVIDGVPMTLEAIRILDDDGQGYTYYDLRSLALALGLSLGWAEDGSAYITFADNLSPQRRLTVENALSLLNKVAYFWGGKSTAIGWDPLWGTQQRVYAPGDDTYNTIQPFGLDCTGFIEWVHINSGLNHQRTWSIGRNLDKITTADALPGDIVLTAKQDHVGLVVGRDPSGDLIICHCSGRRNTVSLDSFSEYPFTYIGRPRNIYDCWADPEE